MLIAVLSKVDDQLLLIGILLAPDAKRDLLAAIRVRRQSERDLLRSAELLPTFTTISGPGAVFAVELLADVEDPAACALGKLISIVTGLEPVSGATLITISGNGDGVGELDGAGEPLAAPLAD